jgi:ElaA protein
MNVEVLGFAELDPLRAYAVWRLRQDVFVVEQSSIYPDLDGRDLEPSTRHLLARSGDRVVGYARVVDDGDAWRIGRVVVARDHRGTGVAGALMDAAMAVVEGRRARLDAQSGLAGWYAAYGFVVTGPEFDDAGIAHVPMERAVQVHL